MHWKHIASYFCCVMQARLSRTVLGQVPLLCVCWMMLLDLISLSLEVLVAEIPVFHETFFDSSLDVPISVAKLYYLYALSFSFYS